MRTTFEIQHTAHELNAKEIVERLLTLKNIYNVEVDINDGLISFDYTQHTVLDRVRKELMNMGFYVINDTQHLNKNMKP
ncbi:hypothetical protein R3X28_11815 [Maribacter sp. TH_r10]|uniref:HMA domain-containing protein n=1 Tax=Maribacter luteus TaxID=2594478 RepID=A0A6I2MNY0_9FLAO|nr:MULTISPECIES: hypothetical protein [Maribacter]MDV7139570.1 hypothetical protein [Maribacter sp. TH_r10]MRX64459.1 hypothetical protein [Maribacter luteus]|tara:strand:+ start:948 stop:1184 length:237 start_codon:yes stop_codon:yes gene_type:complete